MNRRNFVKTGAALLSFPVKAQPARPNVILILADDLGYGDLSCYGSPIQTPNLDRMAREGARFRQFYSASPVCSPSRASLMTGRYPTRAGVPYVLHTESQTGLPLSETTIAEMLKQANYNTMCIGKWHLGSQPKYMPMKRGFDQFFGIPYSNDMWPAPLMRNDEIVERPANQDTLNFRYTAEAMDFIEHSFNAPFFLYLAYATPHVPLGASPGFRGKSRLGLYGDAIQEMDWSIGVILDSLRENSIDDRTLVLFTSDNGPWFQGSAGALRGRKGETLEGGVRVPFLAHFPGRIPAGMVSEGIASTMDILPMLSGLCGAPLPSMPMDGVDIWPILTGNCDAVPREMLLYFDAWNLQCARLGRWKIHVSRYNTPPWLPEPKVGRLNLPLPNAELYDLERDPGESYDVAAENPAIVKYLRERLENLLPTFPDPVLAAWWETWDRSVEEGYPGQYPTLKSP